MRPLYTRFSGLAGLLAFLNQLWSYAPLERTILIGIGTGLGVYLLLILGDLTIYRILMSTPPRLADETAGGTPHAGNAGAASKARDKEKIEA